MWSILTFARFLAPVAWVISVAAAAETCTYETWTWESIQKKVVNLEKVRKMRRDLTSGRLGGARFRADSARSTRNYLS